MGDGWSALVVKGELRETSQTPDREHWGAFGGVESCKASSAWVTVAYKAECLETGIRNTKFGYRCSKTGANRENVIRGDYLYGRRGALSGGIHTAISWQNGLDTNS